MSKLFILSAAVGLCAASASLAASPGLPAVPTRPVTSAKPVPRAGAITINPCSAYGPNFARVDGTDTCVKIGGAVSVGAGTSLGR
jgi:hypothetical protein